MARLYTLIKSIIENRTYKMVGNASSSSPLTITFPNNTRGLIHASSGNSARTGLYSIVTNSAGAVTIIAMISASQLTLASPSDNTLKITSSSTSNAYIAWCGTSSINVT